MEYIIGVSVVVALFGAIIGNGQWAAKRRDAVRKDVMEEISKLAKVVDKLADSVQRHHEDAERHRRTDHLLSKTDHDTICTARLTGIRDALGNLRDAQEKGFGMVVDLIKNGGK